MKKKLHLVQKTVRLTCSWVATGDAKKPLVLVWAAVGTPSLASAAIVNSGEVRTALCA